MIIISPRWYPPSLVVWCLTLTQYPHDIVGINGILLSCVCEMVMYICIYLIRITMYCRNHAKYYCELITYYTDIFSKYATLWTWHCQGYADLYNTLRECTSKTHVQRALWYFSRVMPRRRWQKFSSDVCFDSTIVNMSVLMIVLYGMAVCISLGEWWKRMLQ